MYNRDPGTSFSLIRQSLWMNFGQSLWTVMSQLMTVYREAPMFAGPGSVLAAVRDGLNICLLKINRSSQRSPTTLRSFGKSIN